MCLFNLVLSVIYVNSDKSYIQGIRSEAELTTNNSGIYLQSIDTHFTSFIERNGLSTLGLRRCGKRVCLIYHDQYTLKFIRIEKYINGVLTEVQKLVEFSLCDLIACKYLEIERGI